MFKLPDKNVAIVLASDDLKFLCLRIQILNFELIHLYPHTSVQEKNKTID